MNEEKLLELWQSITGYVEDWESKFAEILEELDSLSVILEEESSEEDFDAYFEDEQVSIDSLKEEVRNMRRHIRQVVKQALAGELTTIDVEEEFRRAGDLLTKMEDEILRLREEADQYDYIDDDYYGEEEEEY